MAAANVRADNYPPTEVLRAAFERVQAKTHWKDPIKAEVEIKDDADMALIRDAVIFYTATIPTFTQVRGKLYCVRAAGYRAGPAGDH